MVGQSNLAFADAIRLLATGVMTFEPNLDSFNTCEVENGEIVNNISGVYTRVDQ